MSIFTKIGAWFAKIWKSLKESGIQVAVTITESIKSALDSGSVGWFATLIEEVFPVTGKIPEEVVAALKANIVKILAAELAVEGIPDNATAADIQTFENNVLAAFKVTDAKSKLYTTLAAQIYGIIEAHNGNTWTFAQLVAAVEQAYQDYQTDNATPAA